MINATGQISPITEKLKVCFDIDGNCGNIERKYEMVLGMDFTIKFKIEIYAAGNEWRVRDVGKRWHQFSGNDNVAEIPLYGECAGIEEINLY